MAETEQYTHIGNAQTVFIKNPNNGAVGSCLGLAFKEVYAPQGYTQVGQAEWDEYMAKLNEERSEFAVTGQLAPLPEGEPEAQDVINAERGVGSGDAASMPQPGLASAGLDPNATHAGEG